VLQEFCCLFAERFAEVLKKQQDERSERERDRIRLLTADPFDHEAQYRIAEEIRYANNFCKFLYSVMPDAQQVSPVCTRGSW